MISTMPTEPTLSSYVALAVIAVAYIVLAKVWHWAFCQSLEDEEWTERRTQFVREMQAKTDKTRDEHREIELQAMREKADREKIEEWKGYREAAKR